jgi:hypothetical protein
MEDGLAAGETGDLGDLEAFDDDDDDEGESDADFGDECAAIDTVGISLAFAIARSCAGEAVADRAYLLGDGFIDTDADGEADEDDEPAKEEKSEEINESADAACARPAENG